MTSYLIPRKVGFNLDGKAVGAGFSSVVEAAPHSKVIMLPSTSVDFVDFDVRGKTEEQIKKEVSKSYPKK